MKSFSGRSNDDDEYTPAVKANGKLTRCRRGFHKTPYGTCKRNPMSNALTMHKSATKTRCRKGFRKQDNGTCKPKISSTPLRLLPPPAPSSSSSLPKHRSSPEIIEINDTPTPPNPSVHSVQRPMNPPPAPAPAPARKPKSNPKPTAAAAMTYVPKKKNSPIIKALQMGKATAKSIEKMINKINELIENNEYDCNAVDKDGNTEFVLVKNERALEKSNVLLNLYNKLLTTAPDGYWKYRTKDILSAITYGAQPLWDDWLTRFLDNPHLDFASTSSQYNDGYTITMSMCYRIALTCSSADYSSRDLLQHYRNLMNRMLESGKDLNLFAKDNKDGKTAVHILASRKVSHPSKTLSSDLAVRLLEVGGPDYEDAVLAIKMPNGKTLKETALVNRLRSLWLKLGGSAREFDTHESPGERRKREEAEAEERYWEEQFDQNFGDGFNRSSSQQNHAAQYRHFTIPDGATFDDMKSQYKKLSLKYHPDKCKHMEKSECERIFKEINNEYQDLKRHFRVDGGDGTRFRM